ncbi:MAG: glycosyltransferase [Bacteroidetes bacterium]|nr:glycosyltransferase [Bacteroidota bacterium]MBV6461193.1 hypothetical protein [Flavobacteriales bacterium]WKZ75400.1 MAG: glycosyltransferase [Vicingaceae bacterium]MCL4817267.1 glycosyltransferase [Flavobacteriales bacterium]NOG95998.1 glycosyltransferase [Bacteroidota bacterium]
MDFILPAAGLVVIVVYSLFFLKLALFFKKETNLSSGKSTIDSATVIVPFRNETENILHCLNALKKQKCDSFRWEVVLVNDHSEDDSVQKINHFISENNLDSTYRVVSLSANEKGKKTALKKAIMLANGELIITTDADCVFTEQWLNELVKAFTPNTHFVFAPVLYQNEKTFFHVFFSLEFLTMMCAGIAMANCQKPVYCNAANMAFRKESYLKIENKITGNQSASGDDVFTLHAFAVHYPEGTKALKIEESVVYTNIPCTLKEILHQRLRWASKSVYYKNISVHYMMLLIGVTNILLLLMLLWSIFNYKRIGLCLIIFAIKCGIDYCFIFLGAKQMKKTKLLKVFLPSFIIYPFYLFVLLLLNFVMPVYWKGRKI